MLTAIGKVEGRVVRGDAPLYSLVGHTMLMTLYATLATLKLKRPGVAKTGVADLPAITREQFGLHGLTLSTALLAGADRDLLHRLRDAADKAGCPCLGLVEPEPLAADPEHADASADRIARIVQAGSWLGCSSVCVGLKAENNEDAVSDIVEIVRPVLRKAERMELNLCLATSAGLTADPERLTDLLKKIGGFRVGTMPDFKSAHDSGDAGAYLRKLVPYAATVLAVTNKFETSGTGRKAVTVHKPYDLGSMCEVLLAVGYDGVVAVDHRGAGDLSEGVTKGIAVLRDGLGELSPEDEAELAELDLEMEGETPP